MRGVLASGIALALPRIALANGAAGVRLGVHPYLPYKELERRFAPLLATLSEALGRPVQLRVARNYDEHIRSVAQREVDLAFMGPAAWLALSDQAPPTRQAEILGQILGVGGRGLSGHIFVRSDSPLSELSQLKGRRVAYGDPGSTMSYQVPAAVLRAQGLSDVDFLESKFLGSHENVVLAVLAGEFDAGAIKEEVFERWKSKGLRSLLKLPEVAEHVLVSSGSLAPEQVTRVKEVLLALDQSTAGQKVVATLQTGAVAIVPVEPASFTSLRRFLQTPQAQARSR